MTQDDGERIAAWLEGLGLAGALAEAGLPTFTRDADGRAVWTEPERLAELEALLRSGGEDPAHAVPVGLVVLARQARLRTELLETPWFTYETLAELRGTSVDATRFAVHKAAQTHRLLVVPVEEHVVVPAFQLTATGEVRPDVAPLLEPLLAGRSAKVFLRDDAVRSLIYTPDASRAMALLGNTGDAFGETWHLPCDDARLTYRELVTLAAEVFGVAPRCKVVKGWQLALAGLVSQRVRDARELLPRYAQDNVFVSDKFRARFPEFRATTFRAGLTAIRDGTAEARAT